MAQIESAGGALATAVGGGNASLARRILGEAGETESTRDDAVEVLALHAADGSALAVELLVETVDRFALARNAVRRYLLDEAAIDDVTQDTLITVARAVGTFRGDANSGSVDNSERVEEAPEETSIILAADVLFDFDQATLTPDALARLDIVADQLADLGPRAISVGGHTDSHGEDAYNEDLSVRRAEAVRDALAERLDGDFTFEVSGFGESEPVAANENEDGSDDPAGRALNRRVEITFPT